MTPTVRPSDVVDGAHPFGVAAGEVIVDGDDVHAASGQRIQESGERGDERFAFAGLHLGDFAFVQHDAADQLHVEMAHAQRAAAGFAHQREGRNHGRFERVGQALLVIVRLRVGVAETLLDFRFELEGFFAKFGVGQALVVRRQGIDRRDRGGQALNVPLVLGADEPGHYSVDDVFDSHGSLVGCSRSELGFSRWSRLFTLHLGVLWPRRCWSGRSPQASGCPRR